jgi:hypothetical protein
MSVTNLTTTYAALSLGLTCAERREVIVKEETLIAMLQHIVNEFLVKFRAERTGTQ